MNLTQSIQWCKLIQKKMCILDWNFEFSLSKSQSCIRRYYRGFLGLPLSASEKSISKGSR